MLSVILYQLLIFVGVMRILSLKVNTPVSPPWKKGRGIVKGLEEWGGILRTHKALQRKVFFSDEFLPSLNAHGRVCCSLIVNPRILKHCIAIERNFIIGPTQFPIHFCWITLLPSCAYGPARYGMDEKGHALLMTGLRFESNGKTFCFRKRGYLAWAGSLAHETRVAPNGGIAREQALEALMIF